MVRLLDFGIAKVLNPQWSQDATHTRTDWRPMTPEYASPEQQRGAPVTKATDIYSLGVLLYELLTGHRPHRIGSAVEQSGYDEETERPSTAVAKMDEEAAPDDTTRVTPQLVAEVRAIRREELPRRLRGDLDTIVMKAIRPEPEDRYASAAELSQDIERHLAGLPIRARKPTLLYRGGKFVRRHAESLTTALLILAVTAGIAVWAGRWLWKLKNATEPTPGAVHVRIRPSVAILGFKNLSGRPDTAWISTALSEMLTTELAAGEQLRTIPDETVARTKIDLGLADAESLSRDTLTQVRKNLGSDFVVLGSYLDLGKDNGGQIRLNLRLEDALKGETVAAVSGNGHGGEHDRPSGAGRRTLAPAFRAGEAFQLESEGVKAEQPSNPEALRPYAQGLASIRTFDDLAAREFLNNAVAADPSFSVAYSELARTSSSLGYDSDAQHEAKKALDGAGDLTREKHLLIEARFYETSRAWSKAIDAYQTLFDFFPDNLEYGLQLANAETAAGRGKDAFNSLAALDALGPQTKNNPRINLAKADAAASLGDSTRRRDMAALAAREAGEQGAKLLLARARDTECRALADLGENEKAKSACKEAREIYEAAGDRSGLAQTLHDMAEVPINQGDFAAAEQLYSQALSISRAIGNQKGQGRELLNLGVISVKNGDLTTARRFYDEAFRHDQEAGDKSAMAAVMGDTGILLRIQGKLQEALNHFQEALELSNQVGHRGSAAQALAVIGDVLLEEGDLPGAYKMYQEASAIEHEIGRKILYASTLTAVGRVLRQQGKANEAQQAYRESLSLEEELGNKSDAAETRLALAELNCDSGKGAEAEQLSRAAVETFRADAYTDEESLAQSMVSKALLQQGKLDEARSAMTEAVRLSQKSQDVLVRIPVRIDQAYVMAAAKNLGGAAVAGQDALTQARNLGLLRLQLEASLALGEIQMQKRNPELGRKRLQDTEENARSKGFALIAQKASTAQRLAASGSRR